MTLSRAAKILRKHRGSIPALAREIGVAYQSVHDVLDAKKTSGRIAAAAIDRAGELLVEDAERSKTEPRTKARLERASAA